MANDSPLRLVALISGRGSNLQAILDNIAAGTLSAQVVAVLSDQPQALGLTKAARAGILAIPVAQQKHQSTDEFYKMLLCRVESFAPDLVVLAGFMRILPNWFIARLGYKIMNIHPSLLPKYKGLHTHQRVLDAGERKHGATVHWVTEELDSGATIIQSAVDVAPDDTAETLCQRVLHREHQIYSHAIQGFAQNCQAICEPVATRSTPVSAP